MLLPLLLISLFSSSWGEASHQRVGEEVSKQTGEVSDNCPDHWIDASLSGLGCLYFNSTAAVSWEDALSWCQHPDNNALLLEIWSELQLEFIRSELMLLQDNGVDNDWWTGGTDLGREGHWFWIGTLATVGDFLWNKSTNEPNGDTVENCLALWNSTNFNFRGNDCRCYNEQYFICQRK